MIYDKIMYTSRHETQNILSDPVAMDAIAEGEKDLDSEN